MRVSCVGVMGVGGTGEALPIAFELIQRIVCFAMERVAQRDLAAQCFDARLAEGLAQALDHPVGLAVAPPRGCRRPSVPSARA